MRKGHTGEMFLPGLHYTLHDCAKHNLFKTEGSWVLEIVAVAKQANNLTQNTTTTKKKKKNTKRKIIGIGLIRRRLRR